VTLKGQGHDPIIAPLSRKWLGYRLGYNGAHIGNVTWESNGHMTGDFT